MADVTYHVMEKGINVNHKWVIDDGCYLKIRTVYFLLSSKEIWHIVRNKFVDVIYRFPDEYSNNIRLHAAFSHPIVKSQTFTLGMRTEDI